MDDSKKTDLIFLLKKLLEVIESKLVDFQLDDQLICIDLNLIKNYYENFSYVDGVPNCNGKIGILPGKHYQEWTPKDQETLVLSTPELKEIYDKITRLVKEVFKIEDEYQIKSSLKTFIYMAITKIANPLNQFYGETNKIINDFIDYLQEKPGIWKPYIWLTGIKLKQEYIHINEQVIIRQAKLEDIERERIFTVGVDSIDEKINVLPWAILEYSTLAVTSIEVQNAVEKLINTLIIYKIGDVNYQKYRLNPQSLFHFGLGGGTLGRVDNLFPSQSYWLSQENANDLDNCIKKIFPKIQGFRAEDSYLDIAFNRYKGSLSLNDITIEHRTALVVSCLEALLSTNSGELTRQLSQRVSILLSIFGFKAISVSNTLKYAYTIRSSFIHGSLIKKIKEKQKIIDLFPSLLEYARVCLLISIQVAQKDKDKDNLIKKIDNALIDKNAYEMLVEEIKDEEIFVNANVLVDE